MDDKEKNMLQSLGQRFVQECLLRARNDILGPPGKEGTGWYIKKYDALRDLDGNTIEQLSKLVDECLVCTLHAFLALLEQDQFTGKRVGALRLEARLQDGEDYNVGALPDGLSGALYGADGWIEKLFNPLIQK